MFDAQPLRAVKRAKYAATVIGVLLLAGAIGVLVLRSFHARALERATELHARRYVATTTPKAHSEGFPVTLPGTLQGVIEAAVYARSSGYVVRWTKDIGASVKKGDLLAEIAAPEIDQQLKQAEAARAQTAASEALAKSTAARWQNLRERDAVTQQDLEERLSAYNQARSDLAAAEANVSRLRTLQGFNRVAAPFDGVVTRRNIDVGDLVDAGSSGTARALFSVAQIDPLRLYVYVPQAYANQVKVGDDVTVMLAERLGEQYHGTIARTARAIDTATRTMQVEIRIPNPNGALIAGSYVTVLLPIMGDSTALVVPTNALLFRPKGSCVAVVGAKGNVHLALVKLGTDFGTTVEVLNGLKSNDRIIINPADSLAEGDVVSVAGEAADNALPAQPGIPQEKG